MIRRLGLTLGCLLALGAGGCDDGGGETDAGSDAGMTDQDAGGGATTVQVVTMLDPAGDPVYGPADFSCLGSRTAPSETGTAVSFDLVAESFGAIGSPTVEGLMVQFFADNMVPLDGSCAAGCTAVTTGAGGVVSVMDVPTSWYAYRIPAGSGSAGGTPTDFVEVVQYNEDAPAADGSVTLNAVSEATQNQILLLLGATRVAGTAVVTGQAFDCNEDAVVNATVRMFDSAGEITLGRPSVDEVFRFYFNGMQFPAPRQLDTNDDGLYGGANLAIPGDNVIRVEIWGTRTEGGAEEMLGCEEVQVNADGVTIMNVGPTRTDGPTGCSG